MLNWIFNRRPAVAEPPARQEPVVDPVSNEADSWNVLRGIFEPPNSAAGAVVNEKTAMRVSTVYACTRLIAGAIAGFPAHIYRRTGQDERERADHPYWQLLNREVAPAYSAATFWEYMVGQVLLRGDGLAYLVRDRSGAVTQIIPLKRSQVIIERQLNRNPRAPHRLTYYIRTEEGAFGADQDDILHLPGFGFDGLQSMSVIEWGARSSTGIAISADDHAGKFFSRGTHLDHVIKAAGKMSEPQQEAFRAAWLAKYSGKGPTGIPLILTEGLDIKELTMTAKDAQLLESRQWQVIDIARAFGVPPFMVGETTSSTSWGSGIEQMGIGMVVYTLRPHLRRFSQEINRKLFARTDYFMEFNTAGLLQGDHAARADYYQAALGGTQNPAWMTPNEVRKLENLPAVDGGDTLSKPEPSNEP
jgi:HK97 family phage portal protein